VLALFAALFWLFNRWTLHITQIAHLDPVPIFCVVASIALFSRHRTAALLMFSLSLGIKQIGIFLAPLYLIWVWQTETRAASEGRIQPRTSRPFGAVGWAALLVCSIPLLAALPFLAWNAEGFAKSILFSATRLPADHFAAPSLDGLMGWLGIPAKVPMLLLMVLALWLAWRAKIGPFTAALLVMASFVDFNSVLFRQYLAWIVPLLPLAVLEAVTGADRLRASHAGEMTSPRIGQL
jgi:hypothetical protein